MAQKKFKQLFAKDFIGIDGVSTVIENDSGGLNRAVNYEYAVGNSVRGRVGCQTYGNGFFAIFPYSYTRTQPQYDITYLGSSLGTTVTAADGASITKLIALNQQMWVRDTMTIPITRVSGTYPFTWYSYVSGADINFNIKANGVSVLDVSLEDGITNTTVDIWTLLGSIDSIAELSISRTTRDPCPPFAVVNGNQTTSGATSVTYGTTYDITVAAGHNFLRGDIITFGPNTSMYAPVGGMVTGVAATTITYVGPQVTLLDGAILGYMNQCAASFPITTAASAASGTLDLVFPYWRLLPEGDYSFGHVLDDSLAAWFNRGTNTFYAPPTATSASGCLYLASSAINTNPSTGFGGYLLKTDGSTVVKAGLPTTTALTLTLPGAGVLNGTYYYKCFLRRVDAQGNITEGPIGGTSIGYAGAVPANNYVGISITPPLYSANSGFQTRSFYKNSTESPPAGASFSVDDGSGGTAFLQPGDPLILTDNTAQKVGLFKTVTGVGPVVGETLGTVHRTYITARNANTIKAADSAGYQINDNTEMSTGLTVVVLRTAVGGNQYYVLAELPVTGYGAVTFFDNVTDAVLTAGEQFIDAPLGKEHDAPPVCSLVCQHQGGLVVARGFGAPNTVGYSSIDGIEYFPTASNSFDVPSTQSGMVSAIASDTNDRLAVFKERAYYDVVGDLDGGAFSINVKNEGDYGITSQASLVRIQDTLIGLSRNGFIVVSSGTLDWTPFTDLNARLIDQDYLFRYAVATNDPLRRSYICTIPITGSEPVSFVIDYSRKDRVRTFERSYPTKIDAAGGYAVVGDEFYHLSQTLPLGVFRRLQRFDGDSPSGNGDGDSFIDNTSAISYILEFNSINNDEPDVLNTPIRLRTYCVPNDYVEEGWVPFAVLVECGASPLAAYIGSANPGGTTSTITFATAADIFKDIKLVSPKTHFYLVRYTTNTIRTSPFISGMELLYAESYSPEDLIK